MSYKKDIKRIYFKDLQCACYRVSGYHLWYIIYYAKISDSIMLQRDEQLASRLSTVFGIKIVADGNHRVLVEMRY